MLLLSNVDVANLVNIVVIFLLNHDVLILLNRVQFYNRRYYVGIDFAKN
ncbi:hypothetical protein FM107_03750 [Sphingobacterium sp. JB170]|nr:hypothetical protein FM107_03750 [Sphingobacterium sp. JB170]